jgi:hypothetical protein
VVLWLVDVFSTPIPAGPRAFTVHTDANGRFTTKLEEPHNLHTISRDDGVL